MSAAPAWIVRGVVLGLLAFAVFGPLANLGLWAFAEVWYYPYKLPLEYGPKYWFDVFKPTGTSVESFINSMLVAVLTVAAALAVSVPAGYALARGSLPGRAFIMLIFLLPQAFPNIAVYINVARNFFAFGIAGTVFGVVLVHTMQALVFAVWITTAAFSAVDRELVQAARNMGATPLRAFFTITLPLAAPGIMASSIFVFLESLDEFTGTFFVGVPDVTTLPILMFNSSQGGNYQIASITALILLVPSLGFMLVVERFLKSDVLAKIGT